MKRIQRLLALFLVICIAAFSLISCSSQKTATAAASTAVSSLKKNISGKIVYSCMWNESEPQADVIKAAKKQFESDYPNATVEVQWVGRTATAPTAIAAGEQIDMFDNVGFSTDPTMFADLSELLDEPSYDMPGKTVYESIEPAFWASVKEVAETAGLTYKYAIPCLSAYAESYFYNKDLFAKAGITEVPKTWDEFLTVCAKLKSAGIVPMTTDDAYMNLTYSYYLSRVIGQDNIDKLAKSNKASVWKNSTISAGIKQTLEAMETLAKDGYWSKNVNTNKYPAGQQEFALGKAAMYLNASWFPGEIKDTAGDDFNYGEFPFPLVTGGVEDDTYNTIGTIPMTVSSKAVNKEGAMEFIRYLCGQKFQKMLSADGFVPCTINTAWPSTVQEQLSMVEKTTHIVNQGCDFGSDFINGSVRPHFNKVLTGGETAEKAYNAIMSSVK